MPSIRPLDMCVFLFPWLLFLVFYIPAFLAHSCRRLTAPPRFPRRSAHISVHDISDEGLSMAISLANNNLTGQLSTAQRRALGGNARDTLFRQLHLPIPLSSTAYRRQQSQSRYG
ncbi:hypothetical protein DMC30DRAFT_404348 [Rhodotorula diobovata]|uniref:Uncharacterized protein n=1 Tax=Rhodotorula diobovata TaxID=5288 RepID=A0A5C5FME2_9BASI|nr:hypothetical protein DMC30DRAFT_404348 [Rhodotorula diobovata]